MSLQNSSLNDLANLLIQKIDRSLIFPPTLNKPEELLNPSRKRNGTNRPPRPPNGFLICRKNVHNQAKKRGICNMRVISKVTGMLWRQASQDEKEQYEKLAARVVNLHTHRYPGFKYRPSSKGDSKIELYQPYVFSISEEVTKLTQSEKKQPKHDTATSISPALSNNEIPLTPEEIDEIVINVDYRVTARIEVK
ncbi:7094_t:CDS:2 [Diversispora eburnea]|uniref:7094_t:CDS:1 n=1 Tax=Diversispora eburnea TaxID=1213867 RepID=A0A9N8Z474_9GLOM|nr:7094_t:CDS:2 [Diversispora eburnea]